MESNKKEAGKKRTHKRGEKVSEDDENLIQFEILDVEKDEVGIINVYSPKETQSNEICGVSYFTDLIEAKNYIFKLYEKQIVELQEKRDRIAKKIIEIATLRNNLENVC